MVHVLKFGGTSMANATNMLKVISIVQQSLSSDKTVVVVSALSGTTDLLIEAAKLASTQQIAYQEKLAQITQSHLQALHELIPDSSKQDVSINLQNLFTEIENLCQGIFLITELSARAKDKIVSYGELLSSVLLSAKLDAMQIPNQWVDARKVILTNANFGLAEVNFVATNKAIQETVHHSSHTLFILPGFIGSSADGTTTTLGRGGSDYTAAIVAAALDANELFIYTDVSGIMTADPRLVPNGKVIPHTSYWEAMELSHFGAKVIYPPTIQPMLAKQIPIWIKNTFAPNDYGTLINSSIPDNENVVRGLSRIEKISLLSLEGSGMVGISGISMRLFGALSKEKINVILITQASSEHSICLAIDESAAALAKEAVDTEFATEIANGRIEPAILENNLSIIALVGENMKNHTGISGRMFGALGRNGVNIRAIAQGSSERNISVVMQVADVKKAINVLHEDFFEDAYKQINVFLVGAGNVGRKVLTQIKQQQNFLKEHLHVQINIIGISTSRNMLLQENGIDLNHWEEEIKLAPATDLEKYISFLQEKNMRNSVFVDVTANKEIIQYYLELIKKSIAVVACNKIASSSSYENYYRLKQIARKFNASYLFETNVGAGLPVISTLNDLIKSGDQIHKIEAVLSGTLNFVFNHYDGSTSFSSVVQQASDEGYTEPDPRIDLSGVDVMRKILILAREAGLKMEMEDITCNAFLPDECMQGSVEDFYQSMLKHEAHFKKLFMHANEKDCRLKFVAKLENGKASVGLQEISKEHTMYHLYGKDNAVLFYTERYHEQPLVIKGAGAGAEVTASGIFADILRTIH